MATYPEGTVLTCSHEGCNCRVVIQAACHCRGAEGPSSYRCACGAELIPVTQT
jgi:metallothionein